MTQEEKLAFAREMRPIIEGDFVIEKNVENEYIGTAKDSIQVHHHHYYGQEPSQGRKSSRQVTGGKPTRPSTLPKLQSIPADAKAPEKMTFSRKGILPAHITLLYSKLVEEKWIAPETPEQDFQDLFSGQRSDCRIIWADKYGKSTLVFLFRYMETEEVISVPKNFSIPNILMGHFVDKDGNFLTNLDHGDPPAEKAGKEIIEFVELLKTKPGRSQPTTSSSGYDDAINPYELESEGLRYRGNKHGSGRNSDFD